MPRVRFEPTIPAFEREKTVHALDSEAPAIATAKDLANSTFFWDMTTCTPIEFRRRFGGTHRFSIKRQRVRWARNQQETSSFRNVGETCSKLHGVTS
jgi:hypothetical protein